MREPARPAASEDASLRWWKEVLLIAVFYSLYTAARDIHGSHREAVKQATANARRIIDFESHLGIFHEQAVQNHFLAHRGFIEFWDGFYGSIHFLAVIAVLVLLFWKFPERYRLWRNTLAITTGLALIGFAFFPLLPPRLLAPPFHFVDTVDTFGGLWSFENDTITDVSNLYAAMPSLHAAWSMWCAGAVVPMVRRRWARPLPLLIPLATIFCIVVTANHYFIDALGGVAVLAAAYVLALRVTPWSGRRHHRRPPDGQGQRTSTPPRCERRGARLLSR